MNIVDVIIRHISEGIKQTDFFYYYFCFRTITILLCLIMKTIKQDKMY